MSPPRGGGKEGDKQAPSCHASSHRVKSRFSSGKSWNCWLSTSCSGKNLPKCQAVARRRGRAEGAQPGRDFRNEPGYYLILKLSWRLFFCKENDTARTCVPGHTPQWRGGGRFPWCCRALRGCGADKHAVGLLSKGVCSSAGGRRLLLLLFAMPRNKSRPYTRSASFFFFFS